jgi:nitrite reductase/ring-hydroxylating ferredoxin subunit
MIFFQKLKASWCTAAICVMAMLFIQSACRRNNTDPLLQAYPLDVVVNINEPSYFDLTAVGGWLYFNSGTARLILYRRSIDEFKAYDNRSTYQTNNDCVVEVLSDNITAKDHCSDSKWILTDGSVIHGPATRPLLEYKASYNSSTGELSITN